MSRRIGSFLKLNEPTRFINDLEMNRFGLKKQIKMNRSIRRASSNF
jgi:hypothetical protein